MQRLLTIFCVFAVITIASAQAQTLQRAYGSGYGTTTSTYGSGSTAYGSASALGGRGAPSQNVPTTPNTPQNTNAAAPSANPGSSDYDRVMNSVNSSTDNSNSGANDDSGTGVSTGQPQLAAPPTVTDNMGNGYQRPLNAGALGVPGAFGSGVTTSPSGTIGLGAYNQGPYANGQVTAPGGTTAAPGPATPVYSGTKN
jgi:hypothetical protein